eukprot:TRINITY_DN1283_c0_g1_i1.p2 TRINITY_DN1283_c0_g1~~TRINITY_DN1283_c0_g1_i1.p2  ORF type:complete len:564 (+),score=200.07 TRINITY_DN1283_c0_g1_i1:2087-3778(+)
MKKKVVTLEAQKSGTEPVEAKMADQATAEIKEERSDSGTASLPPPPPPAGGSPPPPPPPGGKMSQLSMKLKPPVPDVKPHVPTKNFNWSKIANADQINGTIWGRLQLRPLTEAQLNADYNEIERLFAVVKKPAPVPALAAVTAAAGSPATQRGKSTDEEAKANSISFVEPKKQQNIGIVFAKMKQSVEELRDQLLQGNETQFPETVLRTLLAFGMPSEEEVSSIQEYLKRGKKEHLTKTDQFFLLAHEVPHLDVRIKCFIAKQTFPLKNAEIRPAVDTITSAITQLKHSEEVPELLQIILALGNFLNAGTFRGSAAAVRLDALNKLAEIRTCDNRSTLLHYFVRLITQKHPELLTFKETLKPVVEASRISLQTLRGDVTLLKRELQALEPEIRGLTEEAATWETDKFFTFGFLDTMREFLKSASTELQAAEQQLGSVVSNFELLASSYGEDPKTIQPDEFFGVFAKFCANFERAENELTKEKEMLEKHRRLEAERRKREEQAERQRRKQQQTKARASIVIKTAPAPTDGTVVRQEKVAVASEAMAMFQRLQQRKKAAEKVATE